MRTIKTTLLIEIETSFDDDESTEETVRYQVEQDLEDMGCWQVNSCEIIKRI